MTLDMVAKLLRQSGEDPQLEYRFAPPRLWRFDLALPARKIALEIEGGIWTGGRHTSGVGYSKDLEKYNCAAIMGWLVVRVTPQGLAGGKAISLLDGALAARDGTIAPAEVVRGFPKPSRRGGAKIRIVKTGSAGGTRLGGRPNGKRSLPR